MGLRNIRRCHNCNYKTHQKLWTYGKICPVCETPASYKESAHGGLGAHEILKVRKELNLESRNWGARGIER